MGKVAILTDTNSGISVKQASEYGVYVLPTPFYIDDQLYYEGVDLDEKLFFEKQESGAKISTSMPLLGDVQDKWNELLKTFDEVVYIPLSSGLSSSCSTAMVMADDEPFEGKVFVVNNQRISVTMKLSVLEAKHLADEGKSGAEIKSYLEEHKDESVIYLMVDTLEYLKKGGRITPAAAALGSLLKIKPILQIRGEKLDSFKKARTAKQAMGIMLDSIDDVLKNELNDPACDNCCISLAYSKDPEVAEQAKEQILSRYPGQNVIIDPLSLVVCCHTGPGALGITASKSMIRL